MLDEESESRDFWQNVDGPRSTSSPAVSATDANPSLRKKASQIVHQDLVRRLARGWR